MMTLTNLFLAICLVEGNIQGMHPDGVSYGPAGITQGCLTDVNATLGTTWTLPDMDDREKAFRVFCAYTMLRCKAKHREAKPLNRIRAWHPNDDDYAERVLAVLQDTAAKWINRNMEERN